MSKRGRQDDQESVTHAIEVLCCRTPAKSETDGLSLTPLEQQVVALKESIAPHVILMVACGYRVKFYGHDSRAVSRRVGIMCIPGQPFEYSSFPYTRVDLYVHRLVAMGYQVGFADQESAAQRAADGLKSGLFTRTVSQLFSRATLLPTEHVVTNGGGNGLFGASTSKASATAAAEEAEGEGELDAEGGAEGFSVGGVPEARAAAGGAVDASELFLCFLNVAPQTSTSAGRAAGEAEVNVVDDEEGEKINSQLGTVAARTPSLEMTLVSFVTQRRLRFVVQTVLEMEDITQRFDIAEVVVLTTKPVTATSLSSSHTQQPHGQAERSGGVDRKQESMMAHLRRTTAPYLAALPEVYSLALHHALPLNFGPTANGEEDDKRVTVSGFVYKRGQSVDAAIEAYLKPFKLDQVYHLLWKRTDGRGVASPTLTGDQTLTTNNSDTPARLDAAPLLSDSSMTTSIGAAVGAEETTTLHLPGPTLRALDVFHSSVGLRGSLLGLLDHSLTACGARCLRRWLAAPLRTRAAIAARQAATAYLRRGGDDGLVAELLGECARLGDVEAVVGKLHAERCHVVEFVRLLRMVRGVAALAHQLCVEGDGTATTDAVENASCADDDLNDLGEASSAPPAFIRALLAAVCGSDVTQLLQRHAALLQSTATTPLEFFTEGGRTVPEALNVHWQAKQAAEAALEAELQAARATLHLPGLEYRTIAGTAYLLDVPQGKCGRVPADWIVQTRTKSNVRYHTPVIVEQQIARTAATERLTLAAEAAWRQHQRDVVSDAAVMSALSGVVAAIGSLDALHSLAVASRQPGYVMPKLVDVPEHADDNEETLTGGAPATAKATAVTALSIREGRHPILDRLLSHGYVSCSVELRVGGAWLLTGPNMGGKSALMRMVGTFVLLTQIGCAVPAEAAVMPVFDGVYCRMGASDSILEGSSTFLSEMDETSRILRTPSLSRSLVLMDELGRGTSSFDGAAVAAATLEYLLARHATTMFVTHYSYLCDPYISASVQDVKTENGEGSASTGAEAALAEKNNVSCYYMGFKETPGVAGEGPQLVFTYKPCRGVTPSSFGVAIGRKAGLPAAVTRAASVVSAEVEEEHRLKQDVHQLRRLLQAGSE